MKCPYCDKESTLTLHAHFDRDALSWACCGREFPIQFGGYVGPVASPKPIGYDIEEPPKEIVFDFSEHLCFDFNCMRLNGVEYHKPECPKAKPETWRDRKPLL